MGGKVPTFMPVVVTSGLQISWLMDQLTDASAWLIEAAPQLESLAIRQSLVLEHQPS